MSVASWILAARPRTLPAAISPVMVGSALAYSNEVFNGPVALLCLLLALLLQIGSNYANDLYDFKKGTDRSDRVGPKRAVAAGLISPGRMKAALYLVFGLATLTGSYLAFIGGPIFFLIGIFCIIAAIAYTAGPFALAYNGLADLAVFIFFGLVAVMGTYYLMAFQITGQAIAAAIGIGALATNILVVNNTRDRQTDKRSGRRTLAVRFGRKFCIGQYMAMLSVAYVVLIYLLFHSVYVILAYFTLPFAIKNLGDLTTLEGTKLNPTLGRTANLLFFYSVLLSLGLIL